MDISSDRWLSELELEDDLDIFNQCHTMCGFDNHQNGDFTTQEMENAIGEQNQFIHQSFSSESAYSTLGANETFITSTTFDTRPAKYLKTNHNDELAIPRSSSSSTTSSQVLTFGNNTGSPPVSNFDQCVMEPEEGRPVYNGKVTLEKNNKSGTTKVKQGNTNKNKANLVSNKVASTHAAQDHIMAERRRREKLSQRFIALSALVPGLKKMDKASVLGDAIKHLKQLQERVDLLEELTKKRTVQSAVFVNKSQLTTSSPNSSIEDSTCSSNDDHNPESLPEIEARVSDKNVLLRIHCEKNKGVVVNVLSEIEKMNLSVVNSSALPFGTHALDITVVAQMDNDFCVTVKELVNNLRLAFLNFM